MLYIKERRERKGKREIERSKLRDKDEEREKEG